VVKNTELRALAIKYGVTLSTVERDYAQNWLLKNLIDVNMALKGGTGLRKVYFKDYRFSDDLDFTLLDNIGERILTDKISNAIMKAKDESGINFTGISSFVKSNTGYKYKVGFVMSQSMHIQLDITTFDNEKVVLPVVQKEINHIFSDNFYGDIKSYNIREILAEKIRSIFQRGFPRDLYDVWYLLENGVKVDKALIDEKFNFKGIKVNILQIESEREKIQSAWRASLEGVLSNVPDFNIVFEQILDELKKYAE